VNSRSAAAEVADDGGERGGDDGLVQRGQQHGQHQCAVNDEQPAPGRGLLVGLVTTA
jgi:hypothetical protein